MSIETRIRVGVDGVEPFTRAFGLMSGAAGSAGKKIGGAFGGMNREAAAFEKSLTAVKRGIAAIGIGSAIKAGAKDILDASEALSDLQVAAGLSDKEMRKIDDSTFAIAKEAKVLRDEVIEGFTAIQDFTGDLGFAKDNMLLIAKAAKASGTPVKEMAFIAADLKDKYGASGKALEEMLGTLILQGKIGSVPFKTMAREMSSLTALTVSYGYKGPSALAKINAAFQAVKTGVGSAAEATTTLEAFMRDVTNPETEKKLKRLKVNVFDKGADGRKVLRDIDALMLDIARATGGDKVKLVKAGFTAEGSRAFGGLAKAGGIDKFKEMLKAHDEGKTITDDFATKTTGAYGKIGAALTDLKNLGAEINEKMMRGAIEELADLEPRARGTIERLRAKLEGTFGAGSMAGIVGAYGLGESLKTVGSVFGKTMPGLEGVGTGAQHVIVDNWPESMGGGGGGGGAAGGTPAAAGEGEGAAGGALNMAGKLGVIGSYITTGIKAVGGAYFAGKAYESVAEEAGGSAVEAASRSKKSVAKADRLRALVASGKLSKSAARSVYAAHLRTEARDEVPWWAGIGGEMEVRKASSGRAFDAFAGVKRPGASDVGDGTSGLAAALSKMGFTLVVNTGDGKTTATVAVAGAGAGTRSIPAMDRRRP